MNPRPAHRSLLFAVGMRAFLLFHFREKSLPHPLFPPALESSRPLLAAGINSTAARIASAMGVALLGSLAYRGGHLDFSLLATAAALLCLLAVPLTLIFTPGEKPA